MSDRKISILISVSLHLFATAILLFFTYDATLIDPKPTFEIVGIYGLGISNEKVLKTGLSNKYIPQKINLPESFSEDISDVIAESEEKIISKNEIVSDEDIGNSLNKLEPIIEQSTLNYSTEKLTDDEFLNTFSSEFTAANSSENFKLEGEILNRKILYKVFPVYPNNLQKNAKIKLKFLVTPKGTVTNIIAIKRANSTLEDLSINAISQWTFNSILSEANQTGYITFVYLLK